jgi:hypothetical protein
LTTRPAFRVATSESIRQNPSRSVIPASLPSRILPITLFKAAFATSSSSTLTAGRPYHLTLGRNSATNLPQYLCAILAVAAEFPARTPSSSLENELRSLDGMVGSFDLALRPTPKGDPGQQSWRGDI